MEHLLLLHGAIASSKQLDKLAGELAGSYHVHSFNFSGHGGEAIPREGLIMENFAGEIIRYIERDSLPPLHVFGYSMGGYAALCAAQKKSELFRSITTLGTKFDWTPETAAGEARMLNAEKIAEKVPAFAAMLERVHSPVDWKLVLKETIGMMNRLGENPLLTHESLSHLKVPTQILVGELDTTAGIDASRFFAQYANADFHILPATPHPFEKVESNMLVELLVPFIVKNAG